MSDQKTLEQLRRNGYSRDDMELAAISRLIGLALRAGKTDPKKSGRHAR